MEDLGIIERLELKIDRLTTLVLELQNQYEAPAEYKPMNVKDAAEYLGISERALRERIKNKSVPFIKNLQGKIYFTAKYLNQALLAPDQSTIEQLSREMYREFKCNR